MFAFSRELDFTSNSEFKLSKASFRAFQASLFESATTDVCATSLSRSNRGMRSSSRSAPPALPAALPGPATAFCKSLLVRVGSGGVCPATLSNSELIVINN